MGMSDSSLSAIFILVSMIITVAATSCGMLLAAAITALLNAFPFIELPDVYYVSHLPAALNIQILSGIILLALVVSIGAALIPARKIKSMMVAHILKSMA